MPFWPAAAALEELRPANQAKLSANCLDAGSETRAIPLPLGVLSCDRLIDPSGLIPGFSIGVFSVIPPRTPMMFV